MEKTNTRQEVKRLYRIYQNMLNLYEEMFECDTILDDDCNMLSELIENVKTSFLEQLEVYFYEEKEKRFCKNLKDYETNNPRNKDN
jgi:hypothetical protein